MWFDEISLQLTAGCLYTVVLSEDESEVADYFRKPS